MTLKKFSDAVSQNNLEKSFDLFKSVYDSGYKDEAAQIIYEKNYFELVEKIYTSGYSDFFSDLKRYYNLEILARHGFYKLFEYVVAKSYFNKYDDIFSRLFADASTFGQVDFLRNMKKMNQLFLIDIHYSSDYGFRYATANSHLTTVEFYINELQIEQTEAISYFFEQNKDLNSVIFANKLFSMRELKNKLNDNLEKNDLENNQSSIKSKI